MTGCGLPLLIGLFVLCAVTIVISGSRLSLYGNVIAEKTGLEQSWIGMVLVAGMTSLPELVVTSTSSSSLVGSADLALGNIFGSNMFNLSILFIMDLIIRKPGWLLSGGAKEHIVSAKRSLLMILFPLAALIFYLAGLKPLFSFHGHTFPIGLSSALIVILYLRMIRSSYVNAKTNKKNNQSASAEPLLYEHISKKRAFFGFAAAGIIILIAGVFTSMSGNAIADELHLSKTFFGALFLAFATSLPEVSVCISALRNNGADLALGNIFGSNMFNLVIIFFADCAGASQPILSQVSSASRHQHILTASLVILMTCLAIRTMKRGQPAIGRVGLYTFGIFLLYIFGLLGLIVF